jgi:transcriptional regulator with XRE-family HTH domain
MPAAGDLSEVATAFGGVLRARRLTAGLSQEQLAHEAGVDRTYVGLLERGLRQPSLATILSVSAALDIAPEALVKETRLALAGGMSR